MMMNCPNLEINDQMCLTGSKIPISSLMNPFLGRHTCFFQPISGSIATLLQKRGAKKKIGIIWHAYELVKMEEYTIT